MSRRHDEADWSDRVARFVRSPKKVISLDLERRVAIKPATDPKPDTEPKEITP